MICLEKAYSALVRQIRDAVREKAQEVPKFRDMSIGCIHILTYPCCKKADEWLGGLSDFEHEGAPDVADYEHAFTVTPSESCIITATEGNFEYLCVEVKVQGKDLIKRPVGEPYSFCGIHVGVSGASPEENLKCAHAALEAIEDFFADKEHDNSFEAISPTAATSF